MRIRSTRSRIAAVVAALAILVGAVAPTPRIAVGDVVSAAGVCTVDGWRPAGPGHAPGGPSTHAEHCALCTAGAVWAPPSSAVVATAVPVGRSERPSPSEAHGTLRFEWLSAAPRGPPSLA